MLGLSSLQRGTLADDDSLCRRAMRIGLARQVLIVCNCLHALQRSLVQLGQIRAGFGGEIGWIH